MRRYWSLFRHFSNWHDYLRIKYGLIHGESFVFTTRTGIRIVVPKNLLSEFKEIFMSEAYFRELTPLPGNGATVIDIGANVGFFSLFTLSAVPKVRIFAYEPVPTNFELLEKHKSLNPQGSLHLFRMAVAGKSGELCLHINPDDIFSTSASVFDKSGLVHTLRVPCVSLEDIFRDNKIPHCDLLKMDSEGAEYPIIYELPPDYFSRIQRIAMEVHEGKGSLENVKVLSQFLKGHGYRVVYRGRGPLSMLWAERVP